MPSIPVTNVLMRDNAGRVAFVLSVIGIEEKEFYSIPLPTRLQTLVNKYPNHRPTILDIASVPDGMLSPR